MMRELTKQAHRIHGLAVKNWNLTRYSDDKKRDKIILVPWGFDDGLTARLGNSARLLDKFLDGFITTELVYSKRRLFKYLGSSLTPKSHG